MSSFRDYDRETFRMIRTGIYSKFVEREKFFDSGMYFGDGNVNNVIVFLEDKERNIFFFDDVLLKLFRSSLCHYYVYYYCIFNI